MFELWIDAVVCTSENGALTRVVFFADSVDRLQWLIEATAAAVELLNSDANCAFDHQVPLAEIFLQTFPRLNN